MLLSDVESLGSGDSPLQGDSHESVYALDGWEWGSNL